MNPKESSAPRQNHSRTANLSIVTLIQHLAMIFMRTLILLIVLPNEPEGSLNHSKKSSQRAAPLLITSMKTFRTRENSRDIPSVAQKTEIVPERVERISVSKNKMWTLMMTIPIIASDLARKRKIEPNLALHSVNHLCDKYKSKRKTIMRETITQTMRVSMNYM
uniref:Uncharacterized protein n=1 Tax=Cacopsylla melanoneura TaxID=428564 RepID=A0A8D8ZC93_9HEMI